MNVDEAVKDDDAAERVADELATGVSLMGADDMDPDNMRNMVHNVIDRYEAYKQAMNGNKND